jgi:phosphoribosylformylglycinamidine synthase II
MSKGLSPSELESATKLLGHAPSKLEEGLFSAMWSEHCSYKSSKVHLQKLPKSSPRVLVGPGENAGAVDIGDGLCVVFKVESHNHPSFIEPFQGAATGVGGILRDIFTMGARPFATMNLLRFGSPSHPKTPWLVDGATKGLSGYGNCFGVANVVSDVAFDSCYDANILVNAFAIGICKHSDLQSGVAKGVGNAVVYVGAKTGRDGIHGATMASESFDDDSHQRRPTVQVGDPFKEKLLLDACLECFERKLVVGIQDMGAAGLTSSSYEMASRGQSGLALHLDRVPLRDSGMQPYEIMLSESQERMLLVAEPENIPLISEVFARYGLDAAVIGEVTNTKMVELFWHGDRVSSLDPLWLTDEAPMLRRPSAKPGIACEQRANRVPHDENPMSFNQYDRHIGLGTLVAGDESDAALVRLPGTNKAIALSLFCDERLCAQDPFEGARRGFARQVLQLACLGAEPIGATDCLNFGSPEDPGVMWQFEQTIDGLSEAAKAFDVPIVSGNVSFYNQTNDKAIYPTPTLGLVGLREGFEHWATRTVKREDDTHLFISVKNSDLEGVRRLAQWLIPLVKNGNIDTAWTVDKGEEGLGVMVAAPKQKADAIHKSAMLGQFGVV